ncbi:MAG: hypothetical protein QW607_12380 [Desulfurococcaceae archaeon]
MLKEIVANIYEKYKKVVDKDRKVKAVEDVMEELGVTGRIEWYPRSRFAEAIISKPSIPRDIVEMLYEIRLYLNAYDWALCIRSDEVEDWDPQVSDEIVEKARELGNVKVSDSLLYIELYRKNSVCVYLVLYY